MFVAARHQKYWAQVGVEREVADKVDSNTSSANQEDPQAAAEHEARQGGGHHSN